MALFRELLELAKTNHDMDKHLHNIYLRPNNFPLHIRQLCAEWIEVQDWDAVKPDDPRFYRFGETFYKQLLEQIAAIEGSAGSSQDQFMLKMQLMKDKEQLQEHFSANYGEFVEAIKRCLTQEQLIIDSIKYKDDEELRGKDNFENVAQENREINEKIKNVKEELRILEMEMRRLDEHQEKLIVELAELQIKIKNCNQSLEEATTNDPSVPQTKEKLNKQYSEIVNENYSRRTSIREKTIKLAIDLSALMKDVWHQIDLWKVDLSRACTTLTKPKQGIVDILDKMCEATGHLLMRMVQQLCTITSVFRKLPFQGDQNLNMLEMACKQLETEYITEHLKKVFIVERNIPNQVLKVTTGKSLGFSMAVRLLGGVALGQGIKPPTVTVQLYHERDIQKVMDSDDIMSGMCKITNGTDKQFEIHQNGRCMVQFNNMVVERVKRTEKGRNDEFVTDYKHAFVFFTTVKVREKEFKLKALSLPIVVTSQTSQECMARGTLIWNAAFPKPEGQKQGPFDSEEEVLWRDFANVLSSHFLMETGHGLTEENLHYLAKVAFRDNNDLDFNKMCISRQLILKEKLPHREFQFWKWLWSCYNLLREKVKQEWKEGLIHGFISKEDAEAKLKDKPVGTFLIRFSETAIESSQRADIFGQVAVAVKEIHPKDMNPRVFHVKESLTPRDLSERSLAVILDAYQVEDITKSDTMKPLLTHLLQGKQNVPFLDVFGKYIKDTDPKKRDWKYLKGKYRIEIFLADNMRRQRRDSQNVAAAPSPAPSMTSVPSPMSAHWQYGGAVIPEASANPMSPQTPGSPGDDMSSMCSEDTSSLCPLSPPTPHPPLIAMVPPMRGVYNDQNQFDLTPMVPNNSNMSMSADNYAMTGMVTSFPQQPAAHGHSNVIVQQTYPYMGTEFDANGGNLPPITEMLGMNLMDANEVPLDHIEASLLQADEDGSIMLGNGNTGQF